MYVHNIMIDNKIDNNRQRGPEIAKIKTILKINRELNSEE